MGRLQDKVILITGAGSGIGAATSKLYGAQGAIVVAADLTLAAANPVVQAIQAAGGRAMAIAGDIALEADIERMVAETIAAYGRIDVLHNNAAMTSAEFMARDLDVVNTPADVWDRALTVNLRGPALMCRHVIPHMLKTGGGSIIMTGSGKGLQGDQGQTAYSVSKAGLIGLTKYVAAQYGKQGIRANVLVVGLVMTEALAANFPPPVQAMMESHHLTPFLGLPEDVGRAAVFLASDESRFVTGHELFVDGGFTSHSPAFADFNTFIAAMGH